MLNQVYRLVDPRQIEVQTVAEEITDNDIVVRPKYLSVCHADTRYFTGQRPQATLRQKLPMALIHEGVGEVVRTCLDTLTFDLILVKLDQKQEFLIHEKLCTPL